MSRWRDDRVREICQQTRSGDDGSLWILYFDDPYGEPLLASAVADAMNQVDRQLTENLAMIISQISPKAVLFAVPRREGRPRARDRQLWTDLQELLADCPTELTDLLVVGPQRYWSAREAAA